MTAAASRRWLGITTGVCLLLGILIRMSLLGYTTGDARTYLIPWYTYVKTNGVSALGREFTNYTPFYSYMLLASSLFDGVASPLTLVKGISAVFEIGCAAMVAMIVWSATRSRPRAAAGACLVWLAPTVLYNGAGLGQADALWTLPILAAIWAFMQGRNGTVPFAVAFAIKAQAVFLGPFVVGMLLRKRGALIWLAAIPAVYLLIAGPALVAGLPLASVIGVYGRQVDTFHELNMSAANFWALVGDLPFYPTVYVGYAIAGFLGLGLAIGIAESKQDDELIILMFSTISLMAMPYVLPQMHERYFYAAEICAIALACIDIRLAPIAVGTQITALTAYRGMATPPAVLNAILLLYLSFIAIRALKSNDDAAVAVTSG